MKDIAKFSKKTFRGEHGINTKNYRITGLKPATRYQFFVFVEENTGTSFMKPLISGREYGRTYATCKDDTWPEVGVNEESKIDCTIGHHAYYCSKMPEYAANFTTEINSCYCPEETIGGITYNPDAIWRLRVRSERTTPMRMERYLGERAVEEL